MPNKKEGKKYEPPMVKEIGGVFEQAMGATQCTTGGAFQAGDCKAGTGAQTGCPGGLLDQGCLAGNGDTGDCSSGWGF
jgi:hypothetical protein